jgi:Concanavalin A-like lectin/glucanases superfamily
MLLVLGPGEAGAATLVHWWKANGDFNDSIAANNGSPVGNTGFAAGHDGQAFSFDGDDDYVSVPDADSHHFAGSFTIDGWAKTTHATGPNQIAIYYDCAQFCPGNPSDYEIEVRDGRAFGVVRDAAAIGNFPGQIITGGPQIADGAFHHVSLIRDVEARKLSLYVDGVVAAEQALEDQADGPIQNDDGEADPLTIGAQLEGGTTTPVEEMTGLVDDVRLWSGAEYPKASPRGSPRRFWARRSTWRW